MKALVRSLAVGSLCGAVIWKLLLTDEAKASAKALTSTLVKTVEGVSGASEAAYGLGKKATQQNQEWVAYQWKKAGY